jgi:hypothetical protein
LSDGVLGVMDYETDVIHLMTSGNSSKLSEEYLQRIKRGEFIVGNKADTIKKIEKHNLPVIEIRSWHRLRNLFKT